MKIAEKIVVVGADENASFIALGLAHNIPGAEIVWLHTTSPETGHYAYSSMANLDSRFQLCGVKTSHLITRANATLKYGSRYMRWNASTNDFIHAFGDYGRSGGGVHFSHAILKLIKGGYAPTYDSFSLAAQAARQHKCIVNPDGTLNSSLTGVQVTRGDLSELLAILVSAVGIKRVNETAVGIEIAGDNIRGINLSSGDALVADLYIDCTPDNLLPNSRRNYIDWSPFLPADRYCFAVCNIVLQMPLTEFMAQDDGWFRIIPLKKQTVVEFYFMSSYVSDELGIMRLNAYMRRYFSKNIADTYFSTVIKRRLGRSKHPWLGNCIAMGPASCVADVFSHSSLDLSIAELGCFLRLYPSVPASEELANEYNRIVTAEFDRVRDYHCLHYHLLNDEHMGASKEIPDSLQHLLALYKYTGKVPATDCRLIGDDSWLSLLTGMNFLPERYDPILDRFSVDEIKRSVDAIQKETEHTAQKLPAYQSVLAKFTR